MPRISENQAESDSDTRVDDPHLAASTKMDAWRLLKPGSLIDGKYHVVGELGCGAMGIVLLAIDRSLERSVALKIIRPERLRPGFADRFAQEAKVMARLNHPNVVAIHAFGQHEHLPYFVMELVSGQTLAEWIASEPVPTRLERALRILNDVCLGVSAIHAAGTVHRDIKPSNILLDYNLRARVADFGISTTLEGNGTNRAAFAGTPAYMAPEIAFSDGQTGVVTPSADVYSVACVAYQMLTGRLPVEGDSDLELLAQHAIAEVPPPTSVGPDLPPSFDKVLLEGLAKSPRERTKSVESFRLALAAAYERMFEPERILVAEDDTDFREALEIKLHMDFPEAEILCVSNGKEALEVAAQQPVSLAILDLQMPEMGAIPVTAALRAHQDTANIPIVILTAAGGPNEWRLLHQIGADRFLVKPVDLDDVVALIRRMMRERGQNGQEAQLRSQLLP